MFDGTKSEAYSEEDVQIHNLHMEEANYLGRSCSYPLALKACVLEHPGYIQIVAEISNLMRKLMAEQEELSVVDDQFGVPTTCDFIAQNTLKLINEYKLRDEGLKIIHCVPSNSTNWFNFAPKF